MPPTASGGLLESEASLLREVVGRRRPDLLPVVARIGATPLTDEERHKVRGVIVDELCELAPEVRADRRELELGDLLVSLGGV